jgi:hypothetical protein
MAASTEDEAQGVPADSCFKASVAEVCSGVQRRKAALNRGIGTNALARSSTPCQRLQQIQLHRHSWTSCSAHGGNQQQKQQQQQGY